MQLSFGSGAVWGERTDVTGSGIGPRQFGVLQDIQIDFDWTDKELYGQLQFPVAIARGQGKISGKAKFAQILGLLYSDIFFGTTVATGQFAVSQLEAATVPAVTPLHGNRCQRGDLQRRPWRHLCRDRQALQPGDNSLRCWAVLG